MNSMSVAIWKEFPEINRKIALYTGYYSHAVASLGCHCGSISSVTAYIQAPYSITTAIPNIQVIKVTKEDPAVRTERCTSGAYTGYYCPVKDELDKINEHLKKHNITFDSFSEEFSKAIAEQCKPVPIWVLSDVINYGSPARSSGIIPDPKSMENLQVVLGCPSGTTIIGRTCKFADYLIRNEIGYVMESPIVQNPLHRSWGGYSLNRVWLWIPPNHLERTLGVTGQYGSKKFPTLEAWRKKIYSDLYVSNRSVGHYVQKRMDAAEISEDIVDKVVFDGGVFPDENRFTRKAKEA